MVSLKCSHFQGRHPHHILWVRNHGVVVIADRLFMIVNDLWRKLVQMYKCPHVLLRGEQLAERQHSRCRTCQSSGVYASSPPSRLQLGIHPVHREVPPCRTLAPLLRPSSSESPALRLLFCQTIPEQGNTAGTEQRQPKTGLLGNAHTSPTRQGRTPCPSLPVPPGGRGPSWADHGAPPSLFGGLVLHIKSYKRFLLALWVSGQRDAAFPVDTEKTVEHVRCRSSFGSDLLSRFSAASDTMRPTPRTPLSLFQPSWLPCLIQRLRGLQQRFPSRATSEVGTDRRSDP